MIVVCQGYRESGEQNRNSVMPTEIFVALSCPRAYFFLLHHHHPYECSRRSPRSPYPLEFRTPDPLTFFDGDNFFQRLWHNFLVTTRYHVYRCRPAAHVIRNDHILYLLHVWRRTCSPSKLVGTRFHGERSQVQGLANNPPCQPQPCNKSP